LGFSIFKKKFKGLGCFEFKKETRITEGGKTCILGGKDIDPINFDFY
jgi:hypothetical protein